MDRSNRISHGSDRDSLELDTAVYLRRFGVDPGTVRTPDLATLGGLQREHVRSVPFENLAIAGDPAGRLAAAGVDLSVPNLYEKVVENRRGGYCFELNGLFCWLLQDLGYDATRVAARVLNDGDPGIPANHHSIVVDLDRRYVVDVGLGTPKLHSPVPIDGEPISGPVAEWRVVTADRPDEDYRVEIREDDEWHGRYVFTDSPRNLDYFRAANDYLQTAPESPFTGKTHLSIGTETGYVSCNGDTLATVTGDERTERTLSETEWYTQLHSTFGLDIQE